MVSFKTWDALYGDDDTKVITFISDRSKDLISTVMKVFPFFPHAYYLRHLEAKFMKGNIRLGKALKEEYWFIFVKNAYACMEKEYDDIVNDLLATSVDALLWLLQNLMSLTSQTTCLRHKDGVRCIQILLSHSMYGLRRRAIS